MERALGFFLPLRPYRCTSCYRRHWGLRRPVLNLGFSLLLVLAGGVGALFLLARTRAAQDGPALPLAEALSAAEATARATQELPAGAVPAAAAVEAVESPAGSVGPAGPASAEQPQAGGESRAPAVAAAGRHLEGAPPEAGGGVEPAAEAAPRKPRPARGSGPRPAAARFELRGLGLSSVADRLEIAIETGAALPDPLRTRLEDPPRWVFDMPGNWGLRPSQEIVAAHPLADTVRVGHHPDKLRLVIDLGPTPCATPEVRPTTSGVTIVLRPRS